MFSAWKLDWCQSAFEGLGHICWCFCNRGLAIKNLLQIQDMFGHVLFTIFLAKLTSVTFRCYLNHLLVRSQRVAQYLRLVLIYKGCLVQSHSQTGLPTAGCSGLRLMNFFISPQMETPQRLSATQFIFFLYLNCIPCTWVCTHYLFSCHWVPVWLPYIHSIKLGVYTYYWNPLNLLFSRLSSPCSLRLFLYQRSLSILNVFMAVSLLCCLTPVAPSPFCILKPRTGHITPNLVMKGLSRWEGSFSLLTTAFLLQPGRLLTFSAARTHRELVVSLLSTTIPRPLL